MSWRLISVVWWDKENEEAHLCDVYAMHEECDDAAFERVKELALQYPPSFHFLEKKNFNKDELFSIQADMSFIASQIRDMELQRKYPT